jgi:epoxide hydrolase-like predicted phosphatase
MPIKAVFFDVGNVVLISKNGLFRKNLAKFLGMNYKRVKIKIDSVVDLFVKGEITEKEFWGRLFQTFQMPPKNGYKKFILKEFYENWELNKETIKIIESLKDLGYKVGAISDTIKPHVKYCKREGWYKPFNVLVLSHEIGMKKPEEGIYRLALKKMGVKASESIFIDDMKKNIIAAKKIGMKTILFKNTKQLRKELLKFGVLKAK